MVVYGRFCIAILALILGHGWGIAQMTIAAVQQETEEEVSLPRPARAGGMSLAETLARRRSVRDFSKRSLTSEQLGQLLWAAQGISSADGRRTAPSAGALYPLEIYVATVAGLHHYQPRGHKLQRRSRADLRPALSRAALGQSAVSEAAAVFVIAAEVQRTAQKYGAARSSRYVQLEAGHAAQNLLLQAVALGLGGVPIGAFQDGEVRRVLQLPESEDPVYVLAIGYPR